MFRKGAKRLLHGQQLRMSKPSSQKFNSLLALLGLNQKNLFWHYELYFTKQLQHTILSQLF
jgi:hypothetical protein